MIGNAEKRAIQGDVGRPYGREVRLLVLTNDDQLARETAAAFRSDAKKVIKAKKRTVIEHCVVWLGQMQRGLRKPGSVRSTRNLPYHLIGSKSHERLHAM
jgi:hypothetical protein